MREVVTDMLVDILIPNSAIVIDHSRGCPLVHISAGIGNLPSFNTFCQFPYSFLIPKNSFTLKNRKHARIYMPYTVLGLLL